MTQLIRRRVLLALPALTLMSACSLPSYESEFRATPAALPRLLAAIADFVQDYGYRKIDRIRGGVVADYEGLRSYFWVYLVEGDRYVAAFDHKDDFWLMFSKADLFAFLDDFESRIAQVDGVSIGYS